LASKTEAYLVKLVRKKLGSRTLGNPPAPTPHAQNAGQIGFTVTVSATPLTEAAFNVGCAELAAIDFPKNHHKKIRNGQ
jgi:hypothetical protein